MNNAKKNRPNTGDLILIRGRSYLRWLKVVANMDYVIEVMNDNKRWLSLMPNTLGSMSVEKLDIKAGQMGIYLGFINVAHIGSAIDIEGVVLLGDSVYIGRHDYIFLARKAKKPKS